MHPFRLRVLLLPAFLLPAFPFLACAPAAPPLLGGLQVSWTEQPPSFVIERVEGGRTELLRLSGEALAVRRASAEWEMQFGSFRVSEEGEDWATIKRLVHLRTNRDRSHPGLSLAGELDGGGRVHLLFDSPGPGELRLRLEGPAGYNRLRATFACAEADRFLGFGAQADSTEHRGHRVPIWVSEPGIGKTDRDEIDPEKDALTWFVTGTRHASSYPLPTFLSSRGYAFLADTTRRVIFDVCQADAQAWSVEHWDSDLTLRVFDGPEPLHAVSRLTAATGRQPRASDLALAPWNDAIFGSENVRQVASLLRAHRIPSGALWTEDFRGGEHKSAESYRLHEEWDVDRTLYPDIEALADDLHRQGFRFLAYHNTFVTKDTRVMDEARAAGVVVQHPDGGDYLFTGVKWTPTGLVDLTNPAGRSFVQERLERILGYGFDGFMADYAEWLPADAALHDGSDPEAVHNEYPRQYFSVVAEAMKAHPDPNLSTWFVRSGTLGAAPLQPVVWAGDQSTGFNKDDGLPTVVTMGLNLGLAGLAIYGHDIAGYQNFGAGPSTKELFFRWTTVGALSPVMRTHHGTNAKNNWWFGKDEETIAHFRRWASFHARLWPYLRRMADEAHETGRPIMRHMALHATDPAAWTIDDQYLFGDSLLAAPVLEEGRTSREVYFPRGEWLRWEQGEPVVSTGRRLPVDVPLTEAALFAPAGVLIPLLPERLDTLMPAAPPLVDLDDVRRERTLVAFLTPCGAEGRDVDAALWLKATACDQPAGRLGWAEGERVTVTVDGAALGPCGDEARACADHHLAERRLVVRGSGLSALSLNGAPVSLHAPGLNVTELVLRY